MNFPPKNPEREIDQKLVEVKKGDKQAFGVLVEKYHKKLYGYYLGWFVINPK